ncbi:MAG: vWA domain-containing protein [Planctomycetota bacterium]
MASRATQAVQEEEEGWVDDSNPIITFLNRFGAAPAWLVSLGVHLVALMLLGTVVYYPPTQLMQMAMTTDMIDTEEEPVMLDNVQIDTIGTNSDVPLSGGALSAAPDRGAHTQAEVEQKIEERLAPVEIGLTDDVQVAPQDDLVAAVNKVGSASTENTGGTQGAIDRLTFELMASLKERKTLVVWLFDASGSLQPRRELITERFENVYRQLDALDGAASKHLKTAVATFGEKTQILTAEPVDGIQEIIPLVRNIKNDKSGKEFVFSAVMQVGKKFQMYAANTGRKMIMIVVTDEKGDDAPQYLEESITLLRRAGTRCFVVGNAAPFGREKGYVTWTYPESEGGGTEDIEVDQGPESVFPDGLRLSFFGGDGGDLERMSSGYGPYALTRLCAETGGVYLIAEEGNGKRYDPYIMRNYQPDYRPIRIVEKDIKSNKAKYALVDAATKTVVDGIPIPQLTFPANNDNQLREAITEAQKPLAIADAKVNAMLAILEAGEKDRDKITEQRWQAAYDLALGRALAMRARTLGYNTILAEMKINPRSFTKKGNNQWILKASKEVNAVPEIKKKAAKAATYLKRVIDQHPDTPWAALAERELSVPMGWEWTESADAEGRLAMASPEE